MILVMADHGRIWRLGIIYNFLKNAVFWDVTPCGSCKNRRFGGKYRLHYQRENDHRDRNNVSSN
jgi:hypothetical protein